MCNLLTWTVLPNLLMKVMLLRGSRSCSAYIAQYFPISDQAQCFFCNTETLTN